MITIGHIKVSLERREVTAGGEVLRVGTRAFDILELLVRAQGRLVTKDEIFREVWPNTVVEENNLQVHICSLRRTLGADKDLIKTVPGRGYRLVWPDLIDHDHDAWATPAASAIGNLPLAHIALVGRERAIDQVRTALRLSPLVTLVGPGGIGKTELALEVARKYARERGVAAWVAMLSPISNPNQLLGRVAEALGMTHADHVATPESIVAWLGGREALIVLDTCEHMVRAVAEFCEQLLNASARIKILATSREPLRVAFEQLYVVRALDVPAASDDCSAVVTAGAVRMFLARVRALDGQFPMDDESIAQIGLVCRRLDGVPLALELAAERAISLGIGELAAGLDERFCVLTCGLRTAPPRQRTLEASLDWSYQLLTELERVVLERLSVFAEKVRLREIYAVIAYGGLTREQVAEGIIGLVSKSLLMFDSEGPAKQYYLFETTRFYGLQKLSESLHRDAITSRYAQFLETLHPVRESSYERDTDALSVVQSGIHRVHRAPNRGALLLRRFEARMSRVPS